MALALAAAGCAAGMEPVLPRLAEQIREAIAAPRKPQGAALRGGPPGGQFWVLCGP